jgi:hypothetical protein
MWPSLKTRPDCGCSTSAFAGDVLREGGERNARRVVDATRRFFTPPNDEKKTKNRARRAADRRGGTRTRRSFLQSKDGEYIER